VARGAGLKTGRTSRRSRLPRVAVAHLPAPEWTSRPDPEAGALIAVARDVTARKAAEETVRRYQLSPSADGDEIPQCGRIVALADVFDALTHARPYKEAWPVDRAVEEIHRLRGLQFDPGVVEAFDQLDAEELAGRDPSRADDVEAAA
jgi:HD domain